MDFGFSPEEENFKKKVHEFLQSEPSAEEMRKECESGRGFGPSSWKLLQELGKRGWLCPSWPKEYGGLDLPYIYQYIVWEELDYCIGVYACVGTGMAGPIILEHGSEEMKRKYLPRIARGEIEFCLGYSEPEAGSDLVSLQMRAEDKGDYFLINGQKTFNTRCHYAQYHWLATRTSTVGPKHRGISLFIVPLDSPGISIIPLETFGGERTNDVFYDNVKVPRDCLVGEQDKGVYYLMEALDHERITPIGEMQYKLEKLIGYLKKSGKGKNPIVRQKVAEFATEIEVGRLLAAKVAHDLNKGKIPSIESNMLKVFVTELEQRFVDATMGILGPEGQLQTGSKWAILDGYFEHSYRYSLMNLIVRGTSEILQGVIAERGLGLPRTR